MVCVAVDLVGECVGDEGFEGGCGGGLVPGVHGGVEGGHSEVGGGREGEGRAVEVGRAQGVGGVGGAFGEGLYEGAQRGVGAAAVVGQGSPVSSRRRVVTVWGPPAGRGPPRAVAPSWSASRTVSSNGRRAWGPWGPPARGGGLLMAVSFGCAGRGLQPVCGGGGVPGHHNDRNPKVVLRYGDWVGAGRLVVRGPVRPDPVRAGS